MRKYIAFFAVTALLICLTVSTGASAAPVFSPPIDASPSTDDSYAPEVAIDAAGNAVAVWLNRVGPGYVYAIDASYRPAGGTFSAPVQLSDSSQPAAAAPHVKFDGAGNALAVWSSYNASGYVVQTASRPAGGSFSLPVDMSGPGYALSPTVAVNDAGAALVTWEYNDGGGWRVQAASRPAGQSFAAPDTLTAVGDDAGGQEAAIDAAGNAVAIWIAAEDSTYGARTAYMPAGGSFSASARVSEAGISASSPHVAMDAAGHAVAVWSAYGGPDPAVQTASSSGGGGFSTPTDIATSSTSQSFPQVAVSAGGNSLVAWQDQGDAGMNILASSGHFASAFSAPDLLSSGAAYQPEPQVGIDDAGDGVAIWGTPTGVQAATSTASGTFSAAADLSTTSPDSPSARLAVNSDGDAIVVWRSHSYQAGSNGIIQAAVTSSISRDPAQITPPAGGDAPAARQVRPLLSRLRLTPRPFRAEASGSTMIANDSTGGAMIRYRLSKDATTTFTVQIREPGRRAGKRCVEPSPSNVGALRCTRWHTLKAIGGEFTRSGKTGRNSLRFSGRIGGRSLLRGRYRLVAKTVDAAGNKADVVRRSFTIRQ